ncbi:hypothetical protein [Desulfofalx alkaliphila]|uniref:hypothetical protein n=1 Tax=Desulfofalx alkaliphila TaxID=105483 RepID=UPI001A9A49E7|nr:hypothetical protein [Desulfofalx alkaliphila]
MALATPFILKHQKKKLVEGKYSGKKNEIEKPQKKLFKKTTSNQLQNVWGVKDIRNGVVITDDNYHRLIIRIGSLDYYLMSPEEQTVVENVLISLALSLNFPLQLFTTTEMVDTKNCIATMYNRLNDPLLDNMRAYLINSIEYLDGLMQNRSVHVRRSYVVISTNKVEPLSKATAELYRRAETVMGNLSRCGIKSEILDSNGVIDLLYRVLNRGRTVKPSELIVTGGTSLFKGREVNHVSPQDQEKAG